ncbi:hypothetical protein GCM10029992_44990 [Glycomyces albus]
MNLTEATLAAAWRENLAGLRGSGERLGFAGTERAFNQIEITKAPTCTRSRPSRRSSARPPRPTWPPNTTRPPSAHASPHPAPNAAATTSPASPPAPAPPHWPN